MLTFSYLTKSYIFIVKEKLFIINHSQAYHSEWYHFIQSYKSVFDYVYVHREDIKRWHTTNINTIFF